MAVLNGNRMDEMSDLNHLNCRQVSMSTIKNLSRVSIVDLSRFGELLEVEGRLWLARLTQSIAGEEMIFLFCTFVEFFFVEFL